MPLPSASSLRLGGYAVSLRALAPEANPPPRLRALTSSPSAQPRARSAELSLRARVEPALPPRGIDPGPTGAPSCGGGPPATPSPFARPPSPGPTLYPPGTSLRPRACGTREPAALLAGGTCSVPVVPPGGDQPSPPPWGQQAAQPFLPSGALLPAPLLRGSQYPRSHVRPPTHQHSFAVGGEEPKARCTFRAPCRARATEPSLARPASNRLLKAIP